ncbi:type I glutamate--ammonia ligase [Anaerosporobacter sp.]|uniref:type I glutamate--ammonia ligase n=1 Tax=Anaerosporobacter sp. TaxID=1872529 RepID=UPI00286F8150|nr:type I glutamate--ammonia ligase [Anaerosporobacter sp.]
MSNYTKQDIIELVEEEDVEFIRLQFTDIYGTLKNMAVTTSQLEKILNNQCRFDGAAIEGFTSNAKSDLYLHPVLDTFEIFPWRPQQGKVARFLCDVCQKDGTSFEGDSRYVLKKIIEQAAEMGYSFEIGSECEFYLFQADDNGVPTTKTEEKAGFFDVGPVDLGENVRREIVLTLEDMGFEVEASYHEAGASQHQIDFQYDEALSAADNIMTFRMVVRIIAKRHGLHATFMPKPLNDSKGSGMNILLSILKDGENIFGREENAELCDEAKWFIAGVLKHNAAITAVVNPIINSYKRLVPSYNVPAYNGWSVHNRNASVRVPNDIDTDSKIELRSPDSSANPYLTIALYLAAGLEGIRNKEKLPEALPNDAMNQEGYNQDVKRLPKTLIDSIEVLEEDTFIKEVLGNQIVEKYIGAKKKEWNDYCSQVTAWEVEQYLYRI